MTYAVTGLYDTYRNAAATVRDLETEGIPHDQISLLANRALSDNMTSRYSPKDSEGDEAMTGAGAGAAFGAILGGGGALMTLGIVVIPGVGAVLAAGWLVATLAGAAAGALVAAAGGSLIGAMVSNGIPAEDANVYAEGVRRGGTLVIVRVAKGSVAAVETILRRHDMVDPRARGALYRESGWIEFDEAAPAFTEDEPGAHRSDRAI